jgi:1,2-diacylglycerol 3-alpha-glucosyltransferase
LRIAFFTDTFLPNVDGVVRSLTTSRAALEARGHDVFVLTSGSRRARKQNKDPRVFYFRSLPFPPYPQYSIALNPFKAISICRKKEVELIHCHGIASMGVSAIQTSRFLHAPLVGTFHTMIPYATMHVIRVKPVARLAARALWRGIRAFYKPFDLVTTPSRAIKRALAENGVDDGKIIVVPNAVDARKFKPASARVREETRRRLGVDDDAKIILSAGRLSFEKNVDVLLRAFALLQKTNSETRFVITGDGPARKTLEATARELGIAKKVSFVGFVPDKRLADCYSAADCFATASTFETQGLALLEAMACGTPAVGANALAIPEAIHDERNGFLFTPGDARECAEKLEHALTASEHHARTLSRNARATALKYSVPRITSKLVKAYKSVL